MKWYQISKEQLMKQLQSDRQGLSNKERQARLEADGANRIAEKVQIKTWQKIAKTFYGSVDDRVDGCCSFKGCYR